MGVVVVADYLKTPSRETPPLTRGRIATYFVDVIL